MHLHRADPADPDGLVDLLTPDAVDHLLTETAIRTPAVRIAQDGAVLPEARYTRGASLAGRPLTGLVDARRVLELYAGGATLVLQGLHRYWAPLTRLVAELELELGHPCQANAYLTPPGAQGFAVHSDAHDVFVFQTHGTKLWEVHQPPGDDGPGVDEVLMEPGLAMYLPTGTPHAARAQEGASLHVTIGINQLTWRGVLRRTVADVVDTGPEEHLPAGYVDDPSLLARGLAQRLEALAVELRAVDPDRAVERELTRFLTTRPTRQRGGLGDVLAARALHDRTPLRRRAGHPCVLVRVDGDGDHLRPGEWLRVLLGDRHLDVPARLRPALEEVRTRRVLMPADLAGVLDEADRLVLCRRLVREGLLEVTTP